MVGGWVLCRLGEWIGWIDEIINCIVGASDET